MYEFEINGVPLLFDAEDADEMEKVENAYTRMDKAEQELVTLKKQKKISGSALIRGYCKMYRDFFDFVFGDGTADKIFKNQKMKAEIHENAYISFLDALFMQKAASADKKIERWRKYAVIKRL